MEDRVLATHLLEEEQSLEGTLRPQRLGEYIGQERMKESLRVCIDAALGRGEALDHAIFYGPPGLGKTTIAHIIAKEMGGTIRSTSGLVLTHAGDLAAILSNLQPRDVLFIDEIHRLPPAAEEALYPAMEDYQIDLVIGQGPSLRTMKLDLPSIHPDRSHDASWGVNLSSSRTIWLVYRLDFYQPEELQVIISRSARLLNVQIDDDAAGEIARRARGTPRIANRLIKRSSRFCRSQSTGTRYPISCQRGVTMVGSGSGRI